MRTAPAAALRRQIYPAECIPPQQQTLTDVPPGSPFWLYVERNAIYQVISGYSCGGPGEPCDPQQRPYFRPAAGATRGQIAKIVYNALVGGSPCPTAAAGR